MDAKNRSLLEGAQCPARLKSLAAKEKNIFDESQRRRAATKDASPAEVGGKTRAASLPDGSQTNVPVELFAVGQQGK